MPTKIHNLVETTNLSFAYCLHYLYKMGDKKGVSKRKLKENRRMLAYPVEKHYLCAAIQ